jgi:hypothetical protein
MKEHCVACGMPLTKKDIGSKVCEGSLCKFCTDDNGNVKNCEEIFKGGVEFFMKAIPSTDRKFAEKITRKNMNQLPFWKGKNIGCLSGEQATDTEFREVLMKLQKK